MIALVASLLSSSIQIIAVLLIAKFLGASSYKNYSIIFAISAVVSSIIFEWMRMSVARFTSSRCARLGLAVVAECKRSSGAASVLLLGVAVASVLVGMLAGRSGWGFFVGAVLVTASGAGMSDVALMFVRFSGLNREYSIFLTARAAICSALSLMFAAGTHSAELSAAAFGGANLLCGMFLRARTWPDRGGARRGALLWRYGAFGFASSASAISSSLLFAAARVATAGALSSKVAGGVLLAMDLAIRGVTVLGQALTAWGAKPIFQLAAVRGGDPSARLKSYAATFMPIWSTAGLYGCACALFVPTLFKGFRMDEFATAFAFVNIAAAWLLGVRLYCFDLFLSSVGFVRPLSYSSIFVGSSAIVFLCLSRFNLSFTAEILMPASVVGGFVVFIWSGWSRVVRSLPIFDICISMAKVLILGFCVIFYGRVDSIVIGFALLPLLLLDFVALRALYARRSILLQ